METAQTESPRVASLITSREKVAPLITVSVVGQQFMNTTDLDALSVVDCDEPVGLVTRQKFMLTLFRRYGFELYGKKRIIAIADTAPLIIHEEERLDVAMDKALERQDKDIYDEIIVVDDADRYKGCLSVKQMIMQQSTILANSVMQKEIARERARELERMSQVKSQFIANVTHELRSPVNAIIGLAEVMKISTEKGQTDRMKERLSLLTTSAINLRAIITNILDLSKIEAGKMEVFNDSFDLVPLLHEVAETARILAGGKPVDVDVTGTIGSLVILSDMVKVRQIMINLLSNAAKFKERGSITVDLIHGNGEVTISVSDTGIGIRREDGEKIFEAFGQVENAHIKQHEGTGLGLTITRNLVAMLGGRIAMSSSFGEGTTFTITLPISPLSD